MSSLRLTQLSQISALKLMDVSRVVLGGLSDWLRGLGVSCGRASRSRWQCHEGDFLPSGPAGPERTNSLSASGGNGSFVKARVLRFPEQEDLLIGEGYECRRFLTLEGGTDGQVGSPVWLQLDVILGDKAFFSI